MQMCNLFTHRAQRSSQELVEKCSWILGSTWNLEMLLVLLENLQTCSKGYYSGVNLSSCMNFRLNFYNTTHITDDSNFRYC